MLARIRSIHLLTFHHPDDKRQRRTVVSLLKVIQKIHEIYPDAAVENIGETDFIVTYEEQDGKGGIIHGVKNCGCSTDQLSLAQHFQQWHSIMM